MTHLSSHTKHTIKTNILGFSCLQMEGFLATIGEPKFRATQIIKWMHQFGVSDFDAMTNVSKSLRQKLKQIAVIEEPQVLGQWDSKDGTRKWVLGLRASEHNQISDATSSAPPLNKVEMVLIPEGNRATLCVSSQIGCALDCSFCSTGKQGFNRNLTAAEIIAQLRIAIRSFGDFDPKAPRRVTNVVFMGMGEPLLNFNNVLPTLALMMDDNAYNLSKRRVTLSTAGLVPGIDALAKATDVSLAISLHAPNDDLRNQLVPINRKYNIQSLLSACRRYLENLPDKRVITIEYTLIDGINDHVFQAKELSRLLKSLPCKLNLIPFNPFPHSGYKCSTESAIKAFQKTMSQSGIMTTVRTTRGDDINAACGQLVGLVADRTRRSTQYEYQQAPKLAAKHIPVANLGMV